MAEIMIVLGQLLLRGLEHYMDLRMCQNRIGEWLKTIKNLKIWERILQMSFKNEVRKMGLQFNIIN